MLDFYLLADNKNVSGYLEELGTKIVGSIDFETFERLKTKRIIPERFDYHSDFRWDSALVLQIRDNIERLRSIESDARTLLQILDIAKVQGYGLVAYAD